MKDMKKLVVLILSVLMVLGTSATTFAASIEINSTADPNKTQTDTTEYTYYKILDATIEDDSKITVNPATGESTAPDEGENAPRVTYYVTTQAKATAIAGTNLFNVVKDATKDKWYVELKNKTTTAVAIAEAFNTIKAAFADESGTFAQTTPGGKAKKEGLDPGYYLITSTLGDKLAVQTLADVNINTKNSYPTVGKTIPETDKSAQIGDTITYTLTIDVPASANDQIVLTDTMTEGLTFSSITSVKSNADGNPDVSYGIVPNNPTGENVKTNGNKFTMTFSAETVAANKGKKITVIYTAVLNEKAVVDAADATDDDATSNDNTVKINYGNHYESKPVTVETDTQKFTFDKVDGTDNTKLPGAEFELRKAGAAVQLIEVAAGETYRVASAEEIANASVTKVTKMTTAGKVITVNGVDGDVTYTLVETKAPTGYELPSNPNTEVKPKTDNTTAVTIKNNKGTELPSTGGMGTTILYIIGGALVAVSAIMLVAKKRTSDK